MGIINRLSIRAKMLVVVLVTLAIGLVVAGIFFQVRTQRLAQMNAVEITNRWTEELAARTRSDLEQTLGLTRSLANWFSVTLVRDTVSIHDYYLKMLRAQAGLNPNLHSIWVDLEHSEIEYDGYDPVLGVVNTPVGAIVQQDIRNPALQFATSGYAQAKRQLQELLLEPFYQTTDGIEKMLTWGVCVPTARGGMVGVTLPVDRFKYNLERVEPYPNSLVSLLSANSTVIAHTNDFYTGKGFQELMPEVEINHAITDKVRRGSTYSFTWQAEDGTQYLSAITPVSLGASSLKWAVMVSIPRSELIGQAQSMIFYWLIVGILILALVGYLLHYFAGVFTQPLSKLNTVIDGLAQGDIDRDKKLAIATGDELEHLAESINRLIEGLNETESFAREIGKGNLDCEFQVHGEKDLLGQSLLEMQKSLKHAKEFEAERMAEEKKQSWTTQGIAMFSEILRQNNDNMEELSFGIIQNLVKYTDSNQGGVFVANEKGEDEQQLKMTACYAYDRRKFLDNNIQPGEGLVGRCFIEGKTIFMTDVPEEYIKITSGLGLSRPRCLLIIPLKMNDEVLGVIEIASFKVYEKHQIEFVEKIAESIASTISTVRINIRTNALLAKSQQQAEEMASQDEEMRQNMEELQATNEQLETLRNDIELQQRMLIDVLNEIPEKIFLKDDKGKYLIANKLVADNYGKSVDEIIGKSDFDFYPEEEAREYFQNEQDIIRGGKALEFEEGDVSRYDGLIVRSLKKPFFIEHLGVTGLLGVQFDISEIKRKEHQAKIMAQEISEKQDELAKVTKNLQKEMALMDALMENIPDNIYFKDLESRFIRTSHNMADNFKVDSVTQLYGKSDFDFFTEEHARPAFEDEQEIIRSDKPIIDKIEKETYEDGRDVAYVSTTKMPLKDKEGTVIGTFGISRDISHVMNLEVKAKSVIAQMELTTKMLDGISLKTPVLIYRIKDGDIEEIKGAGLKLLGFTAEALANEPFGKAFPGAKRAIERGIEDSFEFTDKGVAKGKSWEMKHSLFRDTKDESILVGYAYQMGLV